MNLRKMSSLGYYGGVLLPVTIVGTLAIAVVSARRKGGDGYTGIGELMVIPLFIAPIMLLTGLAYRFGTDKTAKITLAIGVAILSVVVWFFNGGSETSNGKKINQWFFKTTNKKEITDDRQKQKDQLAKERQDMGLPPLSDEELEKRI